MTEIEEPKLHWPWHKLAPALTERLLLPESSQRFSPFKPRDWVAFSFVERWSSGIFPLDDGSLLANAQVDLWKYGHGQIVPMSSGGRKHPAREILATEFHTDERPGDTHYRMSFNESEASFWYSLEPFWLDESGGPMSGDLPELQAFCETVKVTFEIGEGPRVRLHPNPLRMREHVLLPNPVVWPPLTNVTFRMTLPSDPIYYDKSWKQGAVWVGARLRLLGIRYVRKP